MAEPRHRDPAGDGFVASLGRYVAAALGVVVVMAGLFWGIGSLDGRDGELVVADSPTSTGSPDAGAGSTSPTATGTGDASPTPTDTGTPGTPSETDTTTSTPSPTPEESRPAEAEAIPPGEISIQVLDAVRIEGNTATEELADELEADGYDVVVVQDAAKVYEVTTVFYTPGFEESAQQVAAQYGFSRVEEKPDNLSDTVRVHLVVGRDRA